MRRAGGAPAPAPAPPHAGWRHRHAGAFCAAHSAATLCSHDAVPNVKTTAPPPANRCLRRIIRLSVPGAVATRCSATGTSTQWRSTSPASRPQSRGVEADSRRRGSALPSLRRASLARNQRRPASDDRASESVEMEKMPPTPCTIPITRITSSASSRTRSRAGFHASAPPQARRMAAWSGPKSSNQASPI